MSRINILNKSGFLTNEERKEELHRMCDRLMFKSCLDLSEPIEVSMIGTGDKITLEHYSRDLSAFMLWWSHFVLKDLNGFQGTHSLKFTPINFKIV